MTVAPQGRLPGISSTGEKVRANRSPQPRSHADGSDVSGMTLGLVLSFDECERVDGHTVLRCLAGDLHVEIPAVAARNDAVHWPKCGCDHLTSAVELVDPQRHVLGSVDVVVVDVPHDARGALVVGEGAPANA